MGGKEIRPIFDYIDQEKQANKKWSELPSKAEDVYIPLLNVFVNEIKKASVENEGIQAKNWIELWKCLCLNAYIKRTWAGALER